MRFYDFPMISYDCPMIAYGFLMISYDFPTVAEHIVFNLAWARGLADLMHELSGCKQLA